MEHMSAAMHSHVMGLFRRKAKDNAYDFGWGMAWRWGFLIGGILFLAIAMGFW